MNQPVDLEISVAWLTADRYRLEFRLNSPYDETVPDPVIAETVFRTDDLESLRREERWSEYAAVLSEDVFGALGGSGEAVFRDARARADLRSAPLRLRLLIHKGSPLLHGLVWETLLDPARTEQTAAAWLSTRPGVYLSRFLAGGKTREISLRHKYQVRALVFVADPEPPFGIRMARVNVEAEVERACRGLNGILTRVVASEPGRPGQATLANLVKNLEDAFDILYLVCHGRFDASETPDSLLYLEDAQGKLDRVNGKEFVTRLEDLAVPPSLVILVSCQTAGDGSTPDVYSDDALASLGPRLTRAGVPAVLAMQGDLRMDTAAQFMPVLLQGLQQHGIIDRAVSEARAAVQSQPDFYVPTLFHRLKSGRLWYGEEDRTAPQEAIKWDALLGHVREGRAAVIVGSGLLEPYVGSQSELATRLAQKYAYPFSEKDREDLARVAEYIAFVKDKATLHTEVLRQSALQVLRNYSDAVPELLGGRAWEEIVRDPVGLENRLSGLLLEAWRYRRRQGGMEPHLALAQLPFKAYISTNPDNLLETALSEHKRPLVWRAPNRLKLREGQPSRDEPLLAYIYGTYDDPSTLVLTEDDYFAHLVTALTSDAGAVKELNGVFVRSALIFLGFRLHEWDFRIFFRRLQRIDTWERHKLFSHVAVQIDPSSAGGTASPAEIKRYITNFIDSSKIEIFEGSVDQFVSNLTARLGLAATVGGGRP